MGFMMSLHALAHSPRLAKHHARDASKIYRIARTRRAAGDLTAADAATRLAYTYLHRAKEAGWTIAQGLA